jgi:hypothetical protein
MQIEYSHIAGGNTMRYKIIKPRGYKKLPFPVLDEWTALLMSGKYIQGHGCLVVETHHELMHCCLALLSIVQGRLKKVCNVFRDGDEFIHSSLELSKLNPLVQDGYIANGDIHFPKKIIVIKDYVEGDENNYTFNSEDSRIASNFVQLNDRLGLTFVEIAEIANALYYQPKDYGHATA